jgi:uncharacterized damage-inducible protein DinB
MHTYFVEYLEALRNQHAEIKRAYADLPTAGLDWKPIPGANSLAALAAHVAGAQTFLLGDLISGRPSQRQRDSEFATEKRNVSALDALLDAAMEDSRAVLESLSLDDLATERFSERHQRNFTVAWMLHHALDHASQHAGHAQLTRQLWDQQEHV